MTTRTNRDSRWPLLAASLAVLGCCSVLVAAPQAGATESSAAEASPVEVPEAVQKILNAAIKAMGGREAINEIDAMHTKMELSTQMGSMTAEHWWKKPNKSLTKQAIPQMGEMSSGTDGTVWWRNNPMMGYQIISEKEADSIGPGGFLAEMLDVDKSVKESYRELEALGTADFGGRRCERIRGVSKDGPGTTVMYFDAATGLPAGAEMTEDGRGGPQTSTMVFRDWKAVDTVKLFHTMEFNAGGQTAKAEIRLIEFNNVPATMFELPEEVKTLVANQPKATDESGGEKTLESFDPQQRAMIEGILRSTDQVKDPQALREMVANMSRGLDYMPQQQKEAMEFAIKRIEARIKKLGG